VGKQISSDNQSPGRIIIGSVTGSKELKQIEIFYYNS
jgi:hypothetical protein